MRQLFFCIISLFLLSCNDSSIEKKEVVNTTQKIDTIPAVSKTVNYDSAENKLLETFAIKNIKTTSNTHFKEFISFTFQNNSAETITNILFCQKYDRDEKKKEVLVNKEVNLKSGDSLNFNFEKKYNKLFLYKIRFSSGKTETYDHDPFIGNTTIYCNSFF